MNYFLLLLLTLGLYSFCNKIHYYFYKTNENIIVNTFIFSSFFALIYLINSYLLLFNINSKYFSYFFILFSAIVCIFQRREILNYVNIIKSYFIKKNKLFLLLLFFYFLTILLPPADEDSLRYHLEIGKKINDGSFYLNTWLDYIALGAHEFINSFALHFKFENISSYTNFVYLSFAIISNIYILKKYKQGSGILSGLILLSCPYLIALISSQKFYFFPCYIVSYSIAYLYLEKKIDTLILYLILTLNIFCFIIKPIFLPYLILVSLWIFIKKKNYYDKILYLIFFSTVSVLFYFPIFLIKFNIYNDPFLPLISINNENTEWLSIYNYYLTNWNMDFTDSINNLYVKYLLIPFKLVFPLQPADLFKTLGLGLLFLFSINYKKNKYLLGLIIFFIFSVIILNNFQSRWFLPLLIFVAIFANLNRFNFLKKITYLQLIGVFCILIPMGLATFASNLGLLNKKFLFNKTFQAHKMIEYINENYEDEKVFSTLNYFYYFDNVVPVYYPYITTKIEPDYYRKNEETTKLILWKDEKDYIDKIISKETNENFEAQMGLNRFVDENFQCKKIKKIKDFEFGAGRNFLNHKKNKTKFSLFRMVC